jgi:hypothetical protein
LHHPFQGFGQPDFALWRNPLVALHHPLVSGQEQRLGVGVALLRQQGGEVAHGKLLFSDLLSRQRDHRADQALWDARPVSDVALLSLSPDMLFGFRNQAVNSLPRRGKRE